MSDPVSPQPSDVSSIFRVVCAWCDAVLAEGQKGAPTSHGICPGCADKMDSAHAVVDLVLALTEAVG